MKPWIPALVASLLICGPAWAQFRDDFDSVKKDPQGESGWRFRTGDGTATMLRVTPAAPSLSLRRRAATELGKLALSDCHFASNLRLGSWVRMKRIASTVSLHAASSGMR